MKKVLRLSSVLLYLAALTLLVLYTVSDIQTVMPPLKRLAMLACVCIALYCGSYLLSATANRKTACKTMKCTFLVFFILYVILLVTLVLFDSYFGRSGVSRFELWNTDSLKDYISTSINLIPFKTIYEYIHSTFVTADISERGFITNIFGNLAAFASFAFFLPLLFNKINTFKKFITTMLCVVITAELLQFILLTGSCDIDDIIINVTGAVIMYGILNISIVNKAVAKITKAEHS